MMNFYKKFQRKIFSKTIQLHFACNVKENPKYSTSKNGLVMYPEFFCQKHVKMQMNKKCISLKFIKNLETSSVSLSGLDGHIKIQENSQI